MGGYPLSLIYLFIFTTSTNTAIGNANIHPNINIFEPPHFAKCAITLSVSLIYMTLCSTSLTNCKPFIICLF